MRMYELKLFVVSKTSSRNLKIISVIDELLKKHLKKDYSLEIVDVLENPEKAIFHKIMVTPTILREEPPPARRVVGDLSDRKTALAALRTLRTERIKNAKEGLKNETG